MCKQMGLIKEKGASHVAEAGLVSEAPLMSVLLHLEAQQNTRGFDFWKNMKGFSPFLL